MKLSESKLALAKVINENGGWIDDSANWAVQPKHEDGDIWFSSSDNKPYRNEGKDGFTFDGRGLWIDGVIKHNKLHQNWHQCVLSREEYCHAYPKADADGWIEWNGGECPVGDFDEVQVKYRLDDRSGMEGCEAHELHWQHEDADCDIVAYRLHKPEVKPEFCESVARSIPEPEAKPTIERLAQDYRNAKDYADRLQKEAGEAAVKAESFAVEISKKILDLQELIGISRPEKELELVITDCRDLMIGDEVECTEYDSEHRFGVVCRIDESSEEQPIMVYHGDGRGISWPSSWKFIRRP